MSETGMKLFDIAIKTAPKWKFWLVKIFGKGKKIGDYSFTEWRGCLWVQGSSTPRLKMYVSFWFISWARMLEGLCGILTGGFHLPHWSIRATIFFRKRLMNENTKT